MSTTTVLPAYEIATEGEDGGFAHIDLAGHVDAG